MIQVEPEGAAEVWKWAAGLLAGALTVILGVIARALVKPEKSDDGAGRESWERERSGVLARMEALEKENVSLRVAKHEGANRFTAIGGQIDDLQRVQAEVRERLARIEGRQHREG